MSGQLTLFWFRRDLRLGDNAGLYHALRTNREVLPVFIFDQNILEKLHDKTDRRVNFIYGEISRLKNELNALGSDLLVFYGKPGEVWKRLLKNYSVKEVYTNRDYEPYAIERDQVVKELLANSGTEFHLFKDQCVFEKDEILKQDGKPYTVYTPFAKKWKEKVNSHYLKSYPTEKYFQNFQKTGRSSIPTLEDMGFSQGEYSFPERNTTQALISNYERDRDFPGLDATSHLSLHFRFGTISIREKAREAQALSEKWLNELIWRDFYMYILSHFPHVAGKAFKPAYHRITWRNDEKEFKAWCNGMTGYPIVDAGMRELNATGFMHNRVRMVVASFLCKHLLIDWRWGEAYFAEKLLDYELASNNGGWQWAAGSGVDAAPYFRIFNPALQTSKFDPELKYIRKWVPEIGSPAYPKPVVEHTFARQRCLEVYKEALHLKVKEI